MLEFCDNEMFDGCRKVEKKEIHLPLYLKRSCMPHVQFEGKEREDGCVPRLQRGDRHDVEARISMITTNTSLSYSTFRNVTLSR